MEEFSVMFGRVLIANRGEIARRIIRACHKVGAKAVVAYSEADAHAPYLAEADDSICIGPPPALKSYLNQDALLKAAEEKACHAVHPGYGFLSENALFALRCEQQKLTFIGPKPSHILLMGDKARARATMAMAGLPVLQGTQQILTSLEEGLEQAARVGYPVLLKATAGGGGKGMRVARTPAEFKTCYPEAQMEAQKAFSNGGLYLEKFIEKARHIEFQILADHEGNVLHLGERECSLQRHHQKLLEESPACFFDPAQRQKAGERLKETLRHIGYLNAGTLEFLMDDQGELYFMEMNTRVQVEHPVTELVTGIDIVEQQLRIAAREALTIRQEDVQFVGHAIECRINAEDPNDNFRPTPGRITKLQVPANSPNGPVRFDTHIAEGFEIVPNYDSMIGKLIVHDGSRKGAIKLMQTALSQLQIEGVKTTIPLQEAILSNAQFQTGHYHTRFIEEELAWPKSS